MQVINLINKVANQMKIQVEQQEEIIQKNLIKVFQSNHCKDIKIKAKTQYYIKMIRFNNKIKQ